MKNPIHVSDTLSLPLDFVTSTQAILAQKGKGKTHTAIVEAEDLLEAGQQIVVLDPTDAWHGLRSSVDGKRAGYPIAVFGGDHGDVALEPGGGKVLAEAVVAERFSAIISTENLSGAEELRFVADFLEDLYRRNRAAMHLFVDEADLFAPQKPFGGEMRTCGAMDNIVRRGRKKGIGCTLITQRSSVLNKNVLSQADMLVALGCSHPRDIDAIAEWVKRHASPARAVEMMNSLPSLPRGEAWIWNPAAEIFKRVSIRDRRTFDSGATPKAGEAARVAKVLAPVDIKRLGDAIAATVEQQKANDPRALKARVAELEKRIAAAKPATAKIEEKPVVKDAQLKRIELAIATGTKLAARLYAAGETATQLIMKAAEVAAGGAQKIEGEIAELRKAIVMHRDPTDTVGSWRQELPRSATATLGHRVYPSKHAAIARTPKADSGAKIGGGLRRILIALAQRPDGLTNRQIGVRAGLSSSGGTFSTYISRARVEGWIEDAGDVRRITSAGLDALGDFEPLPIGRELANYWLGQLGGGAARILQVLIDAFPEYLDQAEIGRAAQISPTGGTFSTYLSKLRTLELVVGRGQLSATPELCG